VGPSLPPLRGRVCLCLSLVTCCTTTAPPLHPSLFAPAHYSFMASPSPIHDPSHPTKQPHASLLRAHCQPNPLDLPDTAPSATLPLCHLSLHPSLSYIPPYILSFPSLFFQSLFTPHSAPASIVQHSTTSIIISTDDYHHIWRRTFRHSNNPIHPSSATVRFLSQARTPSPVAILASATTIPPHTSMTREGKQMNTIHQRNQVTL
jgi:hypothetical protein